MLPFESQPLPSSQFRGVRAFRGKEQIKWLAHSGRRHIGIFSTESAAAKACEAHWRKPSPLANAKKGALVPQSRFKGVYFVVGGRWEAKITFSSKSKHIGTYDTEEEAAKAFDETARTLGVPERCNYDERGNEMTPEWLKGVRRSRNKWRALISVDGQSVNLGMFDTKEEAAQVCRDAELLSAKRRVASYSTQLAHKRPKTTPLLDRNQLNVLVP